MKFKTNFLSVIFLPFLWAKRAALKYVKEVNFVAYPCTLY